MIETVKNIIRDATKELHIEAYELIEILQKENLSLDNDILSCREDCDEEIAEITKELSVAQDKLEKALVSINNGNKPAIEDWCDSQYTEVKNIAYKNKRGESSPSVYINEFITPEAFEVKNVLNKFTRYTNLYNKLFAIGKWLAKNTTWVDEANLYNTRDYYLYPNEVLTTHMDSLDCEDLSFCIASMMPDRIGVCYGYYNNGKEKFGHAFPVFVDTDGEKYIIETTGLDVSITKYGDPKYDAYFIVTKDKTYQVKDGVRFGEIASFD